MPVDAQIILKIILARCVCRVINLPSGGHVTYWMGGEEKRFPGASL